MTRRRAECLCRASKIAQRSEVRSQRSAIRGSEASQHAPFIVDLIMRKKDHGGGPRSRALVLVDESNVGSSVRTAGRGLDWLKLRDFLSGPATGRELIEMGVFAGLPPAMSIWQEERDKKNKFVQDR